MELSVGRTKLKADRRGVLTKVRDVIITQCRNKPVPFTNQMIIRFISYLYTQLLAIIDVVKVSMVENGKMTGISLRTSSLFPVMKILTMMTMMVVMTMMTMMTSQPTTI